MTSRFRYLPCALHPALSEYRSMPWIMVKAPTTTEHESVEAYVDAVRMGKVPLAINLAHPLGWDHAVRAYVAICGGTVRESCDVRFDVFCADDGWEPDGYNAEITIPGRHIPEVSMSRWYEPEGRREALCRCICAALNLDPDVVFPMEKAP